jgi:hypothetical protein
MGLPEELERVARTVGDRLDGDRVVAVLAAEPSPGARRYVCAIESPAGARSWIAVDAEGSPIRSRREVRDTVSIAALCEIAEDAAGGGDLDELRSQLVALRLVEGQPGIEQAEAAALELQRTLGSPPQLATPARLDAIGAATRRLELALDPTVGSPFAAALRSAQETIEELVREVEASYRIALE